MSKFIKGMDLSTLLELVLRQFLLDGNSEPLMKKQDLGQNMLKAMVVSITLFLMYLRRSLA